MIIFIFQQRERGEKKKEEKVEKAEKRRSEEGFTESFLDTSSLLINIKKKKKKKFCPTLLRSLSTKQSSTQRTPTRTRMDDFVLTCDGGPKNTRND